VTVYHVRVGGTEVAVTVERLDGALRVSAGGLASRVDTVEVVPGWYALVVDGRAHDLGTASSAAPSDGDASHRGAGPRRWTLLLDGETCDVEVVRGVRRIAPRGLAGRAPGEGEVRAPMPGIVVTVAVAEGDEVFNGQPLVIIEAMKMQMEIRSPADGIVRRVHAGAGEEVAGGQALVTIE